MERIYVHVHVYQALKLTYCRVSLSEEEKERKKGIHPQVQSVGKISQRCVLVYIHCTCRLILEGV